MESHSVYFRAFIGAVSLKQSILARSRAMESHFRAFIGAVSLKLPLRASIPGAAGSFPRLHRRGLIEAMMWATRPRRPRQISAPSSARSH